MSKYKGYMGKIIKIDLTSQTVEDYPWSDEYRRKYIGGKAVASRIMYDTFKGDEDPLGPENIIVVSTGPVTGLGGPSSNRFDVSALSPQTGITTSSNCGGNFGYYLKRAGYDAVIVAGKSEKPIWVEINDDEITFHDASSLWGMKACDAQTALKKEIKSQFGFDKHCGIATIGPAGENLVRYSAVISGERAAGRAGTGAVFGSKNLKALVSMGSHQFSAYNQKKLDKHHEKWTKYLTSHPITGGNLPRYGTASLLTPMQQNGQLGTKNFSRGTYEDYNMVNDVALDEDNIENFGCLSCPIRCSRKVKIESGTTKGPELETLGLLGPNILNNNVHMISEWNKLLDDFGMDTISAAQTLAWAMEAHERGIWDSGLEYGKIDNISGIIEDIAYRRGVGNDLAEGTKRLSEKYGGTEFAMQVKGLEVSAYQPKNSVGQGLGYAVSNRGGCHLNGGYLISMEGLGLHIDPHTPKAKADLCMFMQDLMESISTQGQCLFTSFAVFPGFLVSKPNSLISKMVNSVVPHVGWAVRVLNKVPEIACFHLGLIPHSKELALVTGIPMTLGIYLRNGERSYNLERALNAKFGVSAENDKLPKELREGIPIDKMKKTYYKARGWGSNGLPSDKKLKSLGIKI